MPLKKLAYLVSLGALAIVLTIGAPRALATQNIGVCSFAPLVAKVAPCLVKIYSNQKSAKKQDPFLPDVDIPDAQKEAFFKLYELFEDFLKKPPHKRLTLNNFRNPVALGVIVHPKGYVLTLRQPLVSFESKKVFWITDNNNQEYKAEIVRAGSKSPLALLKIVSQNSFQSLPLANTKNPIPGSWVLGISHIPSGGFFYSAGLLTVPFKNKSKNKGLIHTDAKFMPYSQGGPLVNLSGEVLGIKNGDPYPGKFHPIDSVAFDLDFVTGKKTEPKRNLGLEIQELTPDLAKALGWRKKSGVLVANVEKKTLADSWGLKSGDIIVSINKAEIKNTRNFSHIMAKQKSREKIAIKIFRQGKYKQLLAGASKINLKKINNKKASEPVKRLGISLRKPTEQEYNNLKIREKYGLVITSLDHEGPGFRANLYLDDIILEASLVKMKNVEDLKKLIKPLPKGAGLVLLVQRKDRKFFATVILK